MPILGDCEKGVRRVEELFVEALESISDEWELY